MSNKKDDRFLGRETIYESDLTRDEILAVNGNAESIYKLMRNFFYNDRKRYVENMINLVELIKLFVRTQLEKPQIGLHDIVEFYKCEVEYGHIDNLGAFVSDLINAPKSASSFTVAKKYPTENDGFYVEHLFYIDTDLIQSYKKYVLAYELGHVFLRSCSIDNRSTIFYHPLHRPGIVNNVDEAMLMDFATLMLLSLDTIASTIRFCQSVKNSTFDDVIQSHLRQSGIPAFVWYHAVQFYNEKMVYEETV